MTSFGLRTRIGAPPARVYQTLTDPSALRAWLDEHAEVALNEGRFDFWGRYSPEGERGRKRPIASEPDRRLSFAWRLQGAETDVEITLQPQGEGCVLTLTQTGVPERRGAEPYVADFWLLALTNLASYAEGRSVAERCEIGRDTNGTARAEVEIDAVPEAVFAALVEPPQLNRWIAQDAQVEPRLGGRYSFGWDHGPIKILDLEPDRTLAYSWRWGDQPETVVRWELEGSGARTRLTLVHSGFTDGSTTAGYQLGWHAFLVGLKRMVEVGAGWQRIEGLEPVPSAKP